MSIIVCPTMMQFYRTCLPHQSHLLIFKRLQVEALAVQLTQREGELIQEKAEVKRLATFLKQVELL